MRMYIYIAPMSMEPITSYHGLGRKIVNTEDTIGTRVELSVIAFSNRTA